MSEKVKDQIRELLEYLEGSVGRIMTADFLTFYKEASAREAIEKIRDLAQKRLPASYAYVVDEEDHLVGVLKRIGIDPAQRSGIILTTVTDVVGFVAFLGFAVMLQGYLV